MDKITYYIPLRIMLPLFLVLIPIICPLKSLICFKHKYYIAHSSIQSSLEMMKCLM